MKIRILLATLALAATAAAAPHATPWYPESTGHDHTLSPHLVLDLRIERGFAHECRGPYEGAPWFLEVCAEVGVWEDHNADLWVQSEEWAPWCQAGGFTATLESTTGEWGPVGVVVDPPGKVQKTGPITFMMSRCDPNTGHYLSVERIMATTPLPDFYGYADICTRWTAHGETYEECAYDYDYVET